MEFTLAADIQKKLPRLIKSLGFTHLKAEAIITMRSFGSSSRARARIWSFPKVWQLALRQKPHYIIEVLSEKFDCLNPDDQTRVLIHELMHIPKNFSGALLPHRGRGKSKIDSRSVEVLFSKVGKGKTNKPKNSLQMLKKYLSR